MLCLLFGSLRLPFAGVNDLLIYVSTFLCLVSDVIITVCSTVFCVPVYVSVILRHAVLSRVTGNAL